MLKESRGVNTVEVFIDRLDNLCDSLENLQDIDDNVMISSTLLSNASKNARLLADTYERDDAFIDEITGAPGFTAEQGFVNDKSNTLGLSFPEALRMVSDCIEDILDGDHTDEELQSLLSYSDLIRRFLTWLRRDYSI
jgi:hypothetical protein